jgi:hypothetical protein
MCSKHKTNVVPDTSDNGCVLQMVRYCKQELKYESVSIITNASKIREMEDWFERYGPYLDILGASCDSASDETNVSVAIFRCVVFDATSLVLAAPNWTNG